MTIAAMLDALHVYHDVEPRSAAMNMAIDEALLRVAELPSLRFYSWELPSLSFGYFGRYEDAATEGGHRELVRRWTGGGTVLHGADLTYSIILPSHPASAFAGSRVIYSEIHTAICRALGDQLCATLAPGAAPKVSDACFANPVEADVIANGRKIAGAAQRRTRAGLLHQGSIQSVALPTDFREAFAAELAASPIARSLDCKVLAQAAQIAEEKYANAAWLRRR